MSGVPLETCSAFSERWNNKSYYKVASYWLFLLIHQIDALNTPAILTVFSGLEKNSLKNKIFANPSCDIATYIILLKETDKSYKLTNIPYDSLSFFTVKGTNMSIYKMRYNRMSIIRTYLAETVCPAALHVAK